MSIDFELTGYFIYNVRWMNSCIKFEIGKC